MGRVLQVNLCLNDCFEAVDPHRIPPLFVNVAGLYCRV